MCTSLEQACPITINYVGRSKAIVDNRTTWKNNYKKENSKQVMSGIHFKMDIDRTLSVIQKLKAFRNF